MRPAHVDTVRATLSDRAARAPARSQDFAAIVQPKMLARAFGKAENVLSPPPGGIAVSQGADFVHLENAADFQENPKILLAVLNDFNNIHKAIEAPLDAVKKFRRNSAEISPGSNFTPRPS